MRIYKIAINKEDIPYFKEIYPVFNELNWCFINSNLMCFIYMDELYYIPDIDCPTEILLYYTKYKQTTLYIFEDGGIIYKKFDDRKCGIGLIMKFLEIIEI